MAARLNSGTLTSLHEAASEKRVSREELAALLATHTTSYTQQPTELAMVPGQVIGMEGAVGTGLTRLALMMLADIATRAPVAVVDTQGWFCPVAAWEVGIPPARLSVIRCSDDAQWAGVLSALMGGIGGIYAEVPSQVPDQVLRRLTAKARQLRSAVVLRPLGRSLPSGMTHMRIMGEGVEWVGPDQGHGRLTERNVALAASGKGVRGREERFGVNDDGTGDVRLVGQLGAAPARRRIG